MQSMNTLWNLKAIAVNHCYTFTTGLYFRYQHNNSCSTTWISSHVDVRCRHYCAVTENVQRKREKNNNSVCTGCVCVYTQTDTDMTMNMSKAYINSLTTKTAHILTMQFTGFCFSGQFSVCITAVWYSYKWIVYVPWLKRWNEWARAWHEIISPSVCPQIHSNKSNDTSKSDFGLKKSWGSFSTSNLHTTKIEIIQVRSSPSIRTVLGQRLQNGI